MLLCHIKRLNRRCIFCPITALNIKIVQYNLQCLCKDNRSKVGRVYPPSCICFSFWLDSKNFLYCFYWYFWCSLTKTCRFITTVFMVIYLPKLLLFSVIMIVWRSKLFYCTHAITNYSCYFEIVSNKNAVKQYQVMIVNLNIEKSIVCYHHIFRFNIVTPWIFKFSL